MRALATTPPTRPPLHFLLCRDGVAVAFGRVAQLVRALVSHTRGPGFESLRDHDAFEPPLPIGTGGSFRILDPLTTPRSIRSPRRHSRIARRTTRTALARPRARARVAGVSRRTGTPTPRAAPARPPPSHTRARRA